MVRGFRFRRNVVVRRSCNFSFSFNTMIVGVHTAHCFVVVCWPDVLIIRAPSWETSFSFFLFFHPSNGGCANGYLILVSLFLFIGNGIGHGQRTRFTVSRWYNYNIFYISFNDGGRPQFIFFADRCWTWNLKHTSACFFHLFSFFSPSLSLFGLIACHRLFFLLAVCTFRKLFAWRVIEKPENGGGFKGKRHNRRRAAERLAYARAYLMHCTPPTSRHSRFGLNETTTMPTT